MRVRFRLSLLLVILVSLPAAASGPVFWTVATAAEFLKGTSDGVFVSLDGVLTAGPLLTNRLSSTAAQIWSLAEAPDGSLWAGTGGDGRLLRLRAGQPDAVAFDADENNIFAVAVSDNRVFAASSPDGRVYVLEGNAPARTFFDPEEKYIWALAVDVAGRLWVGAGNPAVVYRVDPSGASRVVYRPPAAHVVSLARDSGGRMLAGTESPGRLYRFAADDRPFVLLDSGMTELRAAVVDPKGAVYAAGVARGDDPAGSAGETTSVAVTMPPPAAKEGGSTPPTPPAKRSTLFRIDPAGTWEPVWDTPDLIYDLAIGDDGGVLAATGPEGRLYRIERGRDVLLLTGVDAKQITRFAAAPKPGAPLTAFATANPGRVMAPGPADNKSNATFVSAVRDSKSVATWGLIRWEGAGTVALYTRSGNTEKPDDSWSEWAGPYSRKDGDAIKSPAARYLQWRAVLTRSSTPAAQLTSVTVAYLPRNNRPVVTSVTVHPPGVVFKRPFSSDDGAIAGLDELVAEARRPPGGTDQPPPPPGPRMFQKGLQTFAWKAEDSDGDRMTYSLQYRREGEQAWRDLRGALTDPIFVWDTTAIADGRYVLRVVASDSPTNAADRALTGERESDPIDVDNTPPVVTTELTRSGGTIRMIVRVRDAYSPILKLEYSLGGGPWQVVYPADGLADSPDERYEIPLAAEADAARLVVRATDLLQNVTSHAAGK